MLTGSDIVDLTVPRCTYPVTQVTLCRAKAEWVGRCSTCGNDGDGTTRNAVCGEHRFELSGVVEYAADLAGIRCRGCDRPLRLIWEQL